MDAARLPPVQGELQGDLGLLGVALDLGGAAHGFPWLRSVRAIADSAVHREALGVGQRSDRRGQLPGAVLRDLDGRQAAPEGASGRAGPGSARRRRSAARGWSRRRSRRRRWPPSRPDEDAAGDTDRGASSSASSAGELEVLGRELVRQARRRPPATGTATSASGASWTRLALGGELRDQPLQLVEEARRRRPATSSPSSPCSAWAQRSSASSARLDAVVGDDHQLARPGDAVDADPADELALGLLHVAVAGAGDHVDLARRSRSPAPARQSPGRRPSRRPRRRRRSRAAARIAGLTRPSSPGARGRDSARRRRRGPVRST